MDADLQLLERWRDGDARAGNELFSRHFAVCRRFFANKVSREEVQDLVQRTFLGCVRGLAAFRGDCAFRTYLLAIARNELGMHLRRHASRSTPIDLDTSSVRDLGTSPSMIAVRHEEQQRLLFALQSLSVEQQVLLELHYWEGVGGPELAYVLGVAPATVRTRLHRARVALREMLERNGDRWSDARLDDSVRVLRDVE